jgi:SAM-dependent methyltransferase
MGTNKWTNHEHTLAYLAQADTIPHRAEGERILLEQIPDSIHRVLDLGTGDGRLLNLVLLARPDARAMAVDFSPTMLERARARFADRPDVQVVEHTLDEPLPDWGRFDLVVSSFAIHHLDHERKRALYAEIHACLEPGGCFFNLEHVAPASATLHARFFAALDQRVEDEDPSNKLLDIDTQLGWLRELGFVDVDCYWKWLELALLGGVKPA